MEEIEENIHEKVKKNNKKSEENAAFLTKPASNHIKLDPQKKHIKTKTKHNQKENAAYLEKTQVRSTACSGKTLLFPRHVGFLTFLPLCPENYFIFKFSFCTECKGFFLGGGGGVHVVFLGVYSK